MLRFILLGGFIRVRMMAQSMSNASTAVATVQVFTAVIMKIKPCCSETSVYFNQAIRCYIPGDSHIQVLSLLVFSVVTPHAHVGRYWRFGRMYCLHPQQRQASSAFCKTDITEKKKFFLWARFSVQNFRNNCIWKCFFVKLLRAADCLPLPFTRNFWWQDICR
jgi:hypothetical protein